MPFLPPPGEAIQSVDLDQPVPGWFRTAFQLSLTIPVLLALYLIYRRYRPSPISNTQSELRAIGLDAQAALIDLESGVDFKNAILNCYAKMVASLNRQHGIRLETSVTAREFERQLQASGLPLRAIQRLTRLFEMVRYGSQEYSERDRHEAIDCLNEVITAIQAREQSESQQQTQRLPIQPEASR